MSKLEQSARQVLEWYDGNVDGASLAFTALREALANTRSSIRSTSEYSEQAEQECKDCTRSHPHEEMNKCCELRTEIARLRHSLRVKELAEQTEQEPLLWGDDKFAPHERPQNHEPVAWAISHSLGLEFGSKYPMQETKEAAEQMARQHIGAVVVTPLYAAPVRTKDLTDDEIVHLVNSVWFLDELVVAKVNFARAVIAAYKEKNK